MNSTQYSRYKVSFDSALCSQHENLSMNHDRPDYKYLCQWNPKESYDLNIAFLDFLDSATRLGFFQTNCCDVQKTKLNLQGCQE